MSQTYFIGVDIGTTSTKAITFSESGQVKSIGNQTYPLLVPQPAWAEQNPETIFKAVIAAIHDALAEASLAKSQIAAVSFSGAMHSVIAVDAQGYPLTQAIIWADNRSTAQTAWLKQDGSGHRLYRRTGTPLHPMSVLPKLLWLRQVQPECFQQAAKFISIKEYVLYRLLARYVVDYAMASATGLFNLAQLQWDEEAMAMAGIRPNQLSEPVPTTHILQGMNCRDAQAMGLAPTTPIVVGATDGVLANLGVGAISPQQVAITIGTSSAVRTVVAKPITDAKGRTFCYALTPDHWVIGGPSNNGGIVLRWLRDGFCQLEMAQAIRQGVDPYDWMVQAALQVPAGAEGLLCLPFLAGERAPYWNPNARGIFFGVGLHHHKAHFIRAVMEGVLFAVYSIHLALQELAGAAVEIRASGGFVRSNPWCQMLADILGCEVLIPHVYEASAVGAAVLGMSAMGAIARLQDVDDLIGIARRHTPNRSLADTYQPLFSLYERIYHRVTEELEELAAYQPQN